MTQQKPIADDPQQIAKPLQKFLTESQTPCLPSATSQWLIKGEYDGNIK